MFAFESFFDCVFGVKVENLVVLVKRRWKREEEMVMLGEED